MKIEETRVDDVTTVLAITGEFNAHTLPTAQETLDGLIKQLRLRVVVNLGAIEVVTSTAISFLIDAAKRTRKLGGDTVLSEPTKLLLSTVEALEIGDFFQTFTTDDDAIAHFRAIPTKPPPIEEAPDPPKPSPWGRLWPKKRG